MSGEYTVLMLLMILGNAVLPFVILCFKRLRRSVGVMLVVSLMVNVGMFIERFLIIVPSLSHKNMPFVWGSYRPSWVELSVTAAAFAGFALLYTLFAKFFPMVAVTDVQELEARRTEVTLGRTRLPTIVGEE
jgi:molybdopterin-containing oxidoreductase family membrane subunit